MRKEFIQVNGSILDYSKYVREVMIIKACLKKMLAETALQMDFELIRNENPSYCETRLVLFHKEKDLEIELNIKKKSEETFV